ncbi:hypothetical protein BH09GEM1_BH09GEM1_44790 [soil metagenome]
MRPSRFSKEDILRSLARVRAGTPAVQECRQLGVTETTFYRWRKQHETGSVVEGREVTTLREENRKLKQIVADLLLGKEVSTRRP